MPWKSCSSPMGSSSGATPAPKDWCNCWSTSEKSARSRSSLFMKMRRGMPEFRRRLPENLGLDLDAVDGAHHEHRNVGYGQRRQCFRHEVCIPRAVQDVDLVAAPFEGGQGERWWTCDGSVLRARSPRRWCPSSTRPSPVRGPAAQQQGLGQRGLAGAPVADEGHIADLRWWVRFHASTSSLPPRARPVGVPLHGPVQAVPVKLPSRLVGAKIGDPPLPGRLTGANSLSSERGW